MKTCKHCTKHVFHVKHDICLYHECKIIDYAKAQNCPGYTTNNLGEKPEQKEQWMVTFMTKNGGIQTHFLVYQSLENANKFYDELKNDLYVFFRALSKILLADANK